MNFENCGAIKSSLPDKYSDSNCSISIDGSSFADDSSSKDYSCFNTSGLNDSVSGSYNSVKNMSQLNLSSYSSNIVDSPQSS